MNENRAISDEEDEDKDSVEIRREGSNITINGKHLCSLEAPESMLSLLGAEPEARVYRGAHYSKDYLVHDDAGNVIDKWFVARYGWRRFWPPSATLSRVERTMRALRARAVRFSLAERPIAAEIIANSSHPVIPTLGTIIRGLNCHGTTEVEYGVLKIDSHVHWILGGSRQAIRTSVGDHFVRAVEHTNQAWGHYSRLTRIFSDLVLTQFECEKVGIHRLTINENIYWFRLYESNFEQEVESLDNFGSHLPADHVC